MEVYVGFTSHVVWNLTANDYAMVKALLMYGSPIPKNYSLENDEEIGSLMTATEFQCAIESVGGFTGHRELLYNPLVSLRYAEKHSRILCTFRRNPHSVSI